jgi:hypothetical protein
VGQPSYCWREDVMSALDAAETARSVGQIDRLIQRASRKVDNLCHRRFWPETDTRYIDWPDDQLGTSYRLWLDGTHELISATTVTADGTSVGAYFLEPQGSGPPYTRLEIDLSGSGSLSAGSTFQRSIAITGTFGACNDWDLAANTTSGSLTSSATSVTVGTGTPIGVGALLKLDSEIVQVTAKTLATTGITLAANLALNPGATALTVASGDELSIAVGEVITIGTERMLVTDRYTATVIVERQWSGSVLAAHSSGDTIYAYRTLTVQRGQLGTTAATHTTATSVAIFTPPPLVRDLTIAEALVGLGREQSGYARTVGTGAAERNAGPQALRTVGLGDLADLRRDCIEAHGRKARIGSI